MCTLVCLCVYLNVAKRVQKTKCCISRLDSACDCNGEGWVTESREWEKKRKRDASGPIVYRSQYLTQKPNTVIHLMKNDMCNRRDHMHLLLFPSDWGYMNAIEY